MWREVRSEQTPHHCEQARRYPYAVARIFNFSAGPATLPDAVLTAAEAGIHDYNGCGIGVMELSHRSAEFEEIIQAAQQQLRNLLSIPESHEVLFLQGGASLQFAMVPMNFAHETPTYVINGTWGEKAEESARAVGPVQAHIVSTKGSYSFAPCAEDFAGATGSYLHVTSNETIEGIQLAPDIAANVPIVADMSSDILSRRIPIQNYSLIYAGAQKNLGPAGVTVVIASKEFLATGKDGLPPMLNYRVHAQSGSLYNTPTTWSIYVLRLALDYWANNGGLAAIEAENEAKAEILYNAIDAAPEFYQGHTEPGSRSKMNITFRLPSAELEKAFLAETEANGMSGLRGHRSIGGIRASIYNAFPRAGCLALAELMDDFVRRHG